MGIKADCPHNSLSTLTVKTINGLCVLVFYMQHCCGSKGILLSRMDISRSCGLSTTGRSWSTNKARPSNLTILKLKTSCQSWMRSSILHSMTKSTTSMHLLTVDGTLLAASYCNIPNSKSSQNRQLHSLMAPKIQCPQPLQSMLMGMANSIPSISWQRCPLLDICVQEWRNISRHPSRCV